VYTSGVTLLGLINDIFNISKIAYTENRRDRSAKLARAHIPYARVLVVDDVPTNLDVARGMMKPYGMQIDCVTSGQAAIDLIRKAEPRYNAVFMDHMMPEMDGIEATRIIREEIGTEYAKTVPIIALTANAIVGNEDMFLSKGFQAFLSKPIDIMRMDVAINHWVRDKELEKKLSVNLQKEEGVSNISQKNYLDGGKRFTIEGLDIVDGLKRFGEDEEIYLDAVKSYAKNTPPLVDQIRSCTKENLGDYAIIVHGIKSSSRTIGAEALGSRAEILEHAAKAGDFALVNAQNSGFINAVETLLQDLSNLIQEISRESPKQRKSEPDAELLSDLMTACKNYDIDGMDKAMDELESYEYESAEGGELTEWLRTQISMSEFEQIEERLSKYI
jgi:CheY-like chemotaxis protein